MYLTSNLKFLRKRRKLTQAFLADVLNIKRTSINNYESGLAAPPIPSLILYSDYFRVSLDTLLRVDLSALRESQLCLIENGSDVFITGNEIRVLATTVNSQNNDNIELVSIKAKAGYTTGFSDSEYISKLPVFNLPFLSKEKKYRTFQIEGDSMLPIPDQSWVTCEFLLDFNQIKDDGLYVVVTLDDGIVFKKVKNELKEKGSFKMISLNTEYSAYDLPVNKIREVWKFVHYISGTVTEKSTIDLLLRHVETIKDEVEGIKAKLT